MSSVRSAVGLCLLSGEVPFFEYVLRCVSCAIIVVDSVWVDFFQTEGKGRKHDNSTITVTQSSSAIHPCSTHFLNSWRFKHLCRIALSRFDPEILDPWHTDADAHGGGGGLEQQQPQGVGSCPSAHRAATPRVGSVQNTASGFRSIQCWLWVLCSAACGNGVTCGLWGGLSSAGCVLRCLKQCDVRSETALRCRSALAMRQSSGLSLQQCERVHVAWVSRFEAVELHTFICLPCRHVPASPSALARSLSRGAHQDPSHQQTGDSMWHQT